MKAKKDSPPWVAPLQNDSGGELVYVTREGLQKIIEELNYLKTIKRTEVAEHIRVAREYGDLAENAEYSAAKDEQIFVEGKIAELESLMKHATIIQPTSGGSFVRIGSRLRVRMGNADKVYEIVGSHEADPAQGKISHESPMGKSFIGRKKGDTFEIEVPKGKIKIEIVEIE